MLTANSSLPAGVTTPDPPVSCAAKTIETSGWRVNQAVACSFHFVQRARSALGASRGADENGQPVWVTDNNRQFSAFATTSSPARQCFAWLSPTSATVAVAASGTAPEAQTVSSPSSSITSHAPLGASAAWLGVGFTMSASFGLRHCRNGSRDAAP